MCFCRWLDHARDRAPPPTLLHNCVPQHRARASLLGFHENIGNVPVDQNPTISFPFYWTDVRIFDPVPAVNHTANNHYPPKILWGWGEEHPSSIYTPEGDHECGPWWTRSTINSVTITDIQAHFRIVNATSDVTVSEDGPNPFPTGFTDKQLNSSTYYHNVTGLACLDPVTVENPFPYENCQNWVEGNISEAAPVNLSVVLDYTWLVERETIIHRTFMSTCCSDSGCVPCCDSSDTTIDTPIMLDRSVAATFGMHNGNTSDLLLDPMVDLFRNVSRVVYSVSARRNFTKFYPTLNGKLYEAVYFSTFWTASDPYGVEYVMLDLINSTGLKTGDPDAAPYLPENETAHNVSWRLQMMNASSAYLGGGVDNYTMGAMLYTSFPSGSEMPWNATPGYVLFDYFGDPYEGSFKLIHRNATAFLEFYVEDSGGDSATLKMLLVDENRKPIPGASVNVTIGTSPPQTVALGADGRASYQFPAPAVGAIPLRANFEGLPGYKPASISTVMTRLPMSQVGASTSFSGIATGPMCIVMGILGVFIGLAYISTGHVFGTHFIMSIADTLGAMAIANKMGMSKLTSMPASMGRSIGHGVSKHINQGAEAARSAVRKAATKGAARTGAAAGAKASIGADAGKPGGKEGGLAGKKGMDSRALADRNRRIGQGYSQNRAKGVGIPGAGKKLTPEQRLMVNLKDKKQLGKYEVFTSKGSPNEALNKYVAQASRGDTLDYVREYGDAADRIKHVANYRYLSDPEFKQEFASTHTQAYMERFKQACPNATPSELATREHSVHILYETKSERACGFVDPTSSPEAKTLICRDEVSVEMKYSTSVHETVHAGGHTKFSQSWSMHEGPTEIFAKEIADKRGLFDNSTCYPYEKASFEFIRTDMAGGRDAVRDAYFTMDQQRLQSFIDKPENCGSGAFGKWANPALPEGQSRWRDSDEAAQHAELNLKESWRIQRQLGK